MPLRRQVLLHAWRTQQILLLSIVLVYDSVHFPRKPLVTFTVSASCWLRLLVLQESTVLHLEGLYHVVLSLELSLILFFALLLFSFQVFDS